MGDEDNLYTSGDSTYSLNNFLPCNSRFRGNSNCLDLVFITDWLLLSMLLSLINNGVIVVVRRKINYLQLKLGMIGEKRQLSL